MKYILLFFVFCLSLGQLQRINFLDGQINIYFHDIFLILFIVSNFNKYLQDKTRRNDFYKGIKSFLPLVVTGVLSLIWGFWNYTSIENLVGLAYLFRLILLSVFFAQINLIKKIELKHMWNILCTLVLIGSYIQYFFFPNFWPLIYLGWDPHMYRAVGTFFDPTVAGVIFIFIMFSLYFNYLENKNRWYLIGVFLVIPLIFLTYSRITYITFVLSLLYYLIATKNLRFFFIGIIGFVIILFSLPRPEGAGVQLERMFSITSRLKENQKGLVLFAKSPLLGVGFNRIGSVNASSGYPSSFMTVLVSTGLLGLGAFLYLFYQLFVYSGLHERVLLITLMTASIFENVFFVGFVFIFFALSVFMARSGQ